MEERYLISRYDVEQYIFDSDGNCPIDYFLRIEQITTDVEDVIKKLNLHEIADRTLPFLNTTSKTVHSSYYTDISKSIVEKNNERMIRLLEYAF